MPRVTWEFQDDHSNWVQYAAVDIAMLESHRRNGELHFDTTELSFNAGYGSVYAYALDRMTQLNRSSGRIRKLRRIEWPSEEESTDAGDLGFTRALSTMVGATVGSISGPPAATSTTAPLPPPPGAAAADGDTEEDGCLDPPAKKKGPMAEAAALPPPPPTATAYVVTVPTAAAPPPTAATPATSAAAIAGAWAAAPAVPATPPVPSVSAVPAATAPAPLTDAEKASLTIASAMSVPDAIITAQKSLGGQSLRSVKYNLGPVAKDVHGKMCFDRMLSREKQLSGEWAVVYHSYSHAALLYEVQAAVAAVLFRFQSQFATLPRLLKEPFNGIPDAAALLAEFPKFSDRDHNPKFRAVGISVSTNLIAADPEATPIHIFLMGYSCTDLSFVGVLENLLVSCGVPVSKKSSLSKEIIKLSADHGLDVTQFKGPTCKSGRAGHILQMFIKRTIVDRYAYASLPYGVPDKKRKVLSKALEGSGPIQGQARVVPNPSVFMRGNAVRMYTYSADPTFHGKRPDYQKALTDLLTPILGAPDVRTKAAQGIYAGALPSWFNATDFEQQQAKKGGAPLAPPATAVPLAPS